MEGSTTAGSEASERRDEESLAELSKRLTDQASSLAQKEVELAKAELALKGKRLGLGAGAFGAAGLLGLYALGALIATAILALAIVLDAWLAALIVAACLGAAAGVLALAGKQKVAEGTPPIPEEAVESTKVDVEHAKRRSKEGRQ